ncbi:MAG: SpoIIE family protein phosphatase [Bacteroidales bacterium]|nr:MAG: SpoIIE family protein phosphatase [Bacteroidales bacterium]
MTDKRTTIFRQLIFNVILPVIAALLGLGIINYLNTKRILEESNINKNNIISDGIQKVLEFQDNAFEIMEVNLTGMMEDYSSRLVNEIFKNTSGIETADLDKIRDDLGMDPLYIDIYIINQNGIITNTTFEQDQGLDMFGFGEEHKEFLIHVMEGAVFVNERFAIEDKTKRPKKYTYQPTLDGRYIVQIGLYSEQADDIVSFIETAKSEIINTQESVVDVELFYQADVPFSLNMNAEMVFPDLLMELFQQQDVRSWVVKEDEEGLFYEYLYMDRANSDLYKGSVIRIISDRSGERAMLRRELVKFLIIFGLTLLVVLLLIYRKTKVVVAPVKKLAENVIRITHGHLNERAEVVGNNEITSLSIEFNKMIEQLESYTNELEEKVRERTAEIQQQKEEIEAQRDSIEEQAKILAERNEELKEAYHEIEEQKEHIMDSIHYAKRIQTAILPPDTYVHSLIKDMFILYKPKDIVSGDFYWMIEKDGLIMVSAVDCTGHGVPGAFMSIVGYNQLNYAVNVKKARGAAEILEELNNGVTETLREKKGPDSVKDGMDMALCVLNLTEMTLDFAGAYNPLILIRDKEMIQYKGDKFPIGSYEGDQPPRFTNHQIEVAEGDHLYMFSDGYADQFGGAENKKFMIKNFRELLMEIHFKPVDEQKEILDKTIMDWMGEHEQVDDILVMGIKL